MSSKFIVEGGLSIPSGMKLELAGVELTGISNDTALAGASQTEMVTEYAVKSYIDSNNQFTLSDGVNTTSIDASEVLLASDDNAMTITVSNNGIGFAIDVDDASIEIDAASGLQVKALGIATGMLAADAVTGAKIANDAVDSEHIAADSLDSEHYAAGSVDTTALGADAVTGAKIADDSLDSEHYAAGSIDNEHIADGTIANDKLAGSIANTKLVNDSVTVTAGNGLSGGGEVDLGSSITLDLDLSEATAEVIDNSADTFLFIDADDDSTKQESIADLVAGMDGTGLTAASGSLSVDASQTQITALGTIGTGVWQGTTIKTAYIEDLNVTTGKLAADAVTNAKLADNAVETANITDANVTLAKMAADSVDSDQYVDGSIDTAHINDLNVTTGKLAADAVTNAKLADNAVETANITDGNVTLAKMAANSVDSDQYVDGSIDLAHMSAESVDSDQYVDGSIDNEHIADSTIANGKLVNSSLTVTAGNGLKTGGEVSLGGTVTLDLDLNEATAAVIDNSADSFLFVDADDSNNTKKESIADLVAGMDGTGLTAASGSLSVDATQAQITGIGTSGQMTTFAGTVNCDEAVTMDTTLGVTGVATFTAEPVFNGGIDCNGVLAMAGNNIEGTSDDMLIQSGSGLTDYTWSSNTGHMALQAENELVLDSAVRRSSDFAVTANGSEQTMFSFDGSNFHSAKVHVRIGNGTNVTAKELLIVCDESGANPTFVEYGTVNTETDENNDPVEQTNTWDVSASGGTISVKCTGANSNTIKGSFELLKA